MGEYAESFYNAPDWADDEDAWDGCPDTHELMYEYESYRMEQAEDLSICFVTDL